MVVKHGREFIQAAVNVSRKKWTEFKVAVMLKDKKVGEALAEAVDLWLEKNKN